VALAQYSKLFWFPSGELARNVTARVFPENSNALAPLFTDVTGTTPLANPLSTSAGGLLTFWAEEGQYWIHADSEAFLVVVGGAPPVLSPSNTVVPEIVFGQDSTAGVAGTYARGDHTHGTPPAPSGGSTGDRTAKIRVIDDNLTGLTAAASYAVIHTSGGTSLKCPIAAVAGDRLEVSERFMRKGSHFLDLVLVGAAEEILFYGTTESAVAPIEGDPAMYPSPAFQYQTGTSEFVVQPGHIVGGLVTVALAHQGPAAGNANIVYAHPSYPFRLRVKNIGPQPA
jgi:hypothetical protein